jgi:hypothetical protein
MTLHDWAVTFLKEKLSNPGFSLRDLAGLDDSDPRRASAFRELKHALRFVRVSYKSDRLRVRKIHGLVLRAGRYEFELKDGAYTTIQASDAFSVYGITIERISFQQHFTTRGIHLQYPDIFGAVLDSKSRVIIPAELCRIVEGQRYMKLLSKGQQQETLTQLTINPERRLHHIESGATVSEGCRSWYARY